MSGRCPLEAIQRMRELKALEEKYNIGEKEIEDILNGWDGKTYEQIDADLEKIKGGAEIKKIVQKRTEKEGAEKAGLLWEYLPCKDAYNTAKANTLGGRRRRRRSTKKKRRKRNLKKRTRRRRRKSKRRRRR